jgi:hypothetical protein
MSTIAGWWVFPLTKTHWPTWDAFAARQPLTDRFGDKKCITGREHFIRQNLPRLYFGLQPVLRAPSIHRLPAFGMPTLVGRVFIQTVQIYFDDAHPWVTEDNAGLMVVSSPERPTTVNFYKGPYRKAGLIPGSSTNPPTSPYNLPTPFPYTVSHHAFARVRVTRADGRLSTPRWLKGITSP